MSRTQVRPAMTPMLRHLVLAAAALTFATAASAQTILSVTDLGALGGASYGTSLASNGDVAGFATIAGGGNHAFRWHAGSMTELQPLANHINSWATGINASGLVVGYCDSAWVTPHGTYSVTHMCEWLPGSTEATAISCPGAYGGYANATNDAGAVVGEGVYDAVTATGTTAVKRAWKGYGTTTSETVPLFDLPDERGNAAPASAYTVNAGGDVGGWSNGVVDGVNYTRAFVQNFGDQPYDPLLAIVPHSDTWTHDLNDNRDIAGSYVAVYGTLYNTISGFVLKANGTFANVPALYWDESSNVVALNNAGTAVGYSWQSNTTVKHPLLYWNGASVDPNSLLDPSSGWTILELKDLDDQNHFAGTAIKNGQTHAVLLTLADVTGVGPSAASRLAFSGARPSPVHGAARLSFTLPSAGHVRLALYDVTGRVRRVFSGEYAAGEQSLAWDARDDRGEQLEPGVYLARLEAAGTSVSRRIVVTR